MPQLMRTSNPALSGDAFRGEGVAYGGESMTISGAVNKTGILSSCACHGGVDLEPFLWRAADVP